MSTTPGCLTAAPFRLRILCWCFLLLVVNAGCAPRFETSAWIVRTNIASPGGVEEICREAREAGFDSLIVQVRGRGDAYYRSALVLPAEQLAAAPAGFDPLAATLAACSPLPVHAWLNVYLLWSGAEPPGHPLHPAHSGSGWLLEDNNGRSVADYSILDRSLGWIEGIYADPASPLYRELFTGVVAEVVRRYPVAGIHLDYLRYPGAPYGHGGPLGEEFTRKWGLDPRWLPGVDRGKVEAWLAGNLPLHDRVLTTAGLLWAEARAARITELVLEVKQTLGASGRPVPLSAAVLPDAGAAYLDKGQDWRTWAAAGLVDVLYPMVYFGGVERLAGQLRETREVQRHGVQVLAGLGGYLKYPSAIAEEAAVARQLGLAGISLFDLGSLMKKPEGSRPFVEAIAGRRPHPSPGPAGAGDAPVVSPLPASASEVSMLKTIAAKGLGGILPRQPDLDAVFARRWAEFAAARPLFGDIIASMARESQLQPGWVELRGIFRYLNPLDGPERRKKQSAKILLARNRLAAGENFAAVARELSQGGTRNQGGVLTRRWLTAGSPDRQLAALEVGELSPVMEAANGLWCYQLLAKGEPVRLRLEEISWPARRLLFRQHLARSLAGER